MPVEQPQEVLRPPVGRTGARDASREVESPLHDAEIAERLSALSRELGRRAGLSGETPSAVTRALDEIARASRGGFGPGAGDPHRARIGRLDVSELEGIVERELGRGEWSGLERGRVFGHVLSLALDRLLAIGAARGHGGRQEETDSNARRRSGSYFTPPRIAAHLVESAFEQRVIAERLAGGGLRFCDPSVGGGAFLLEAVYRVAERRLASGDSLEGALRLATAGAHGVDVSRLALATTRAALGLFAAVACRGAWLGEESSGPTLRLGDSLTSEEPSAPFDLVVGNPPWVAFQGRAAQPLAPELRATYRARFSAFSGYPTLQGLFAERAAELAPNGVIALLLPSSVADLLGYRNVRSVVRARHEVPEGLTEYGQDAFEGVVQPCFGLIAAPVRASHAGGNASPREGASASERPFVLVERRRTGDRGAKIDPPEVLERIAELPSLPASCFGELGLQSNRTVSQELFLRANEARPPFNEPLLEGRNVAAFVLGPSRLFLHVDHDVLRRTRCSYRAIEQYQRVDFVVRQTAAWTIAARHDGRRFRNSLLAGYAAVDLDADLLVGLLNSSLYRALHVSRQRDARQGAFPQVKVSHLRMLPCPPGSNGLRRAVSDASRALTAEGPSPERLAELERAVDALFSVSPVERADLDVFLAALGR